MTVSVHISMFYRYSFIQYLFVKLVVPWADSDPAQSAQSVSSAPR